VHDCVVEAVWDTAVLLANAPRHAHASVTLGG